MRIFVLYVGLAIMDFDRSASLSHRLALRSGSMAESDIEGCEGKGGCANPRERIIRDACRYICSHLLRSDWLRLDRAVARELKHL